MKKAEKKLLLLDSSKNLTSALNDDADMQATSDATDVGGGKLSGDGGEGSIK